MKKNWLLFGLLLIPSFVFGQWVFNSFDQDPYWNSQVDREDDIETKVIVSYISDPVLFGDGAMLLDYGVTHDQSWGGGSYLNHTHYDSLGVYDFSDYDSLIFWYYNEESQDLPGAVHLRFNLGDVSDSETGNNTTSFGDMEYWYTFHYILDDPPDWNRIALPLVDVREDPDGNGFERTGWYGIDGNDQVDLDMIKGFQMEFSISATEGTIVFGSIILDEMTLILSDGTRVEKLPFNGPTTYSLSQNYPNPFNASTRIDYSITESSFIQLKLFDALGREMQTLINEKKSPGSFTVHFDANELSSGVYFYNLKAGDFNEMKKMTLMR